MQIDDAIQTTRNLLSCKLEKRRAFVALVAEAGFLALWPGIALAATEDFTASSASTFSTGELAGILALVATVACGLAAMDGKLSWSGAMKIVIGMVLILGSSSLVDYVIAGTS